jgi:hypothetical protein
MRSKQDTRLTSAGKDKELTPAARRALQEAEERRAKAHASEQDRPKEVHGREGPDPVRYGDWEKKGIATDF